MGNCNLEKSHSALFFKLSPGCHVSVSSKLNRMYATKDRFIVILWIQHKTFLWDIWDINTHLSISEEKQREHVKFTTPVRFYDDALAVRISSSSFRRPLSFKRVIWFSSWLWPFGQCFQTHALLSRAYHQPACLRTFVLKNVMVWWDNSRMFVCFPTLDLHAFIQSKLTFLMTSY